MVINEEERKLGWKYCFLENKQQIKHDFIWLTIDEHSKRAYIM